MVSRKFQFLNKLKKLTKCDFVIFSSVAKIIKNQFC